MRQYIHSPVEMDLSLPSRSMAELHPNLSRQVWKFLWVLANMLFAGYWQQMKTTEDLEGRGYRGGSRKKGKGGGGGGGLGIDLTWCP